MPTTVTKEQGAAPSADNFGHPDNRREPISDTVELDCLSEALSAPLPMFENELVFAKHIVYENTALP